MKMFYGLCFSLLLFTAACQNSAVDETESDEINPPAVTAQTDPNVVVKNTPVKVPLNGRITVSPEPLISEDAACIVPLRVSNGTDAQISVSMFNFKITGSGQDDTGNMFAQPTPSGESRTARVILIGQSCSAFDTVTISEVLCVSQDNPCPVDVGFEDSSEIKLIGPN